MESMLKTLKIAKPLLKLIGIALWAYIKKHWPTNDLSFPEKLFQDFMNEVDNYR